MANYTDRLLEDFINQHPRDAAATLEAQSLDTQVEFLNQLDLELRTAIVQKMLPGNVASYLEKIELPLAAELLSTLPSSCSLRIVRLLNASLRDKLLTALPKKLSKAIVQQQRYPDKSAGQLLNTDATVLNQNASVSEALHYLRHQSQIPGATLYLVDDNHRLHGYLPLGQLIMASPKQHLTTLMRPAEHCLSAQLKDTPLLFHPGWQHHNELPVIDHDRVFLGVLSNHQLHSLLENWQQAPAEDPVTDIVSLANLYGLSLTQLLNSLFDANNKTGGQQK